MPNYAHTPAKLSKNIFKLKKPPGFLGAKGFFTVSGKYRGRASRCVGFRPTPSQVRPFDGDTICDLRHTKCRGSWLSYKFVLSFSTMAGTFRLVHMYPRCPVCLYNHASGIHAFASRFSGPNCENLGAPNTRQTCLQNITRGFRLAVQLEPGKNERLSFMRIPSRVFSACLPICTICLWITCGKLPKKVLGHTVPKRPSRPLERHTGLFHND